MAQAIAKHNSNALNGQQWQSVSSQLMEQWRDITPEELEAARNDRQKLAALIERKEGIAAPLVENYLHHLERILPRFQQK